MFIYGEDFIIIGTKGLNITRDMLRRKIPDYITSFPTAQVLEKATAIPMSWSHAKVSILVVPQYNQSSSFIEFGIGSSDSSTGINFAMNKSLFDTCILFQSRSPVMIVDYIKTQLYINLFVAQSSPSVITSYLLNYTL